MLLLENVKTVCFLTSERAGAQIFSSLSGVSPEGKAGRNTARFGSHQGRIPHRQSRPPGPRPACLWALALEGPETLSMVLGTGVGEASWI